MTKIQVFLLILASTFLGVLLYVVSPNIQNSSPIRPTPNPVDKLVANINVPETKIFLLGDIMLGRSVMVQSISKDDYSYPFLKVSDRLNEADLVFANLENPIVKDCPPTEKGLKFCSIPEMLKGLTDSGIGIVNIANNHSTNYGTDGISQTKNYLTASNIDYVGDGNLVVKDINGTKFGFLGFDYVDHKLVQADLDLISKSKEYVDVLIVGVHWGVEYMDHPSVTQKAYAYKLLAVGADIIAGHHPHWVQDVEKTDNGLIFYSLGNFVFDQMWSEETKSGIVGKLTFRDKSLYTYDTLTVYMSNWAQPEFVNP